MIIFLYINDLFKRELFMKLIKRARKFYDEIVSLIKAYAR